MSWWMYRRDADGRFVVWQIDVDLMIIVFVLGLLVTFVVPRWMRGPTAIASDAGVLLLAGLSCLTASKISLFRRGVWGSWGPRLMTKLWARLYKIGYGLIFGGVFLLLLAHRVAR